LQFARQNKKPINGTYDCPYLHCLNHIRQDFGKIHAHIFFFDTVKSYTIWTWHEEILGIPTISRTTENFEEGMNNQKFRGYKT